MKNYGMNGSIKRQLYITKKNSTRIAPELNMETKKPPIKRWFFLYERGGARTSKLNQWLKRPSEDAWLIVFA